MYRTFNAYKYPDGSISLGHKNRGGNDYILEGGNKKVMVHKYKSHKDGSEVNKPNRATLTIEALLEKKKKEGYSIVSNV